VVGDSDMKMESKKITGSPRLPKLDPAAAPARVDPAILHTNEEEVKMLLPHLLLVHHVQRRVLVSKVHTSLRCPPETAVKCEYMQGSNPSSHTRPIRNDAANQPHFAREKHGRKRITSAWHIGDGLERNTSVVSKNLSP
jgi:hypothetical protein